MNVSGAFKIHILGAQNEHISAKWWKIKKVKTLCFLKVWKFKKRKCLYFLIFDNLAKIRVLKSRKHAWGTPLQKYIENMKSLCLNWGSLMNHRALLSCLAEIWPFFCFWQFLKCCFYKMKKPPSFPIFVDKKS